MFLIIEEPWRLSELNQLTVALSNIGPRLKEFSLFYVRSVHLIEFPAMAISMDYSGVLDVWIYLTHVL